jgi:hypothetical protein
MLYWRDRISLFGRIVFIGIRMAFVAVILAALCQPAIVVQRNRVETADVAVLADSSMSMSGKDRYEPEMVERIAQTVSEAVPQVESMKRLDVAAAALARNDHAPWARLLQQNAVFLARFAEGAELIAQVSKGGMAGVLSDALAGVIADGSASNLPAGLDLILNRMQGKRIAAVILLSDGRLTTPEGRGRPSLGGASPECRFRR